MKGARARAAPAAPASGAAPHLDPGAGGSSTRPAPVAPQHAAVPGRQRPRRRAPSSGETTSGRANSACALIGTTSSASTSGHTTGPPAENAYAVDPVGVAHDHAVAAPARQRPAVDLDDHLDHPLAAGLLDLSLVERPGRAPTSPPSTSTTTSRVIRSSTRPARGRRPRSRPRRRSSRSASARKPTWPRLTPSSGTSRCRASSAPRRIVPSPPSTTTSSQPSAAVRRRRRARPRRRDEPASIAGLVGLGAAYGQASGQQLGWRPLGPGDAGVGSRPVCVDHQDAARRRSGHLAVPPRRRGPRSRSVQRWARRAAAAGSTRRCRSAPAAGWRRRRARPSPSGAARRDPTDGLGPQRRVADHAARADPLRPTSNCGLTMSTRSAPSAATATSAGSTSASEMNDRSPTTRSGAARQQLGASGRARWCGRAPSPARPTAAARPAGRSRRRRRPPRPRPRRSSTSVKPPVLGAGVEARRPATSSPDRRRARRPACAPPRDDVARGRRRRRTRRGAAVGVHLGRRLGRGHARRRTTRPAATSSTAPARASGPARGARARRPAAPGGPSAGRVQPRPASRSDSAPCSRRCTSS